MELFKKELFLVKEDTASYKLNEKGASTLTNTELLNLILHYDGSIANIEVGNKIMQLCEGDIYNLYKLKRRQLLAIENIGEVRVNAIFAMLEMTKRLRYTDRKEGKKISGSKDIYEMMSWIEEDFYEKFFVILLNRSNRLIKTICISEGGLSGTVVDPKRIFAMALENMASSIILCHNHPSGNQLPSEADIRLTQKMKDAGTVLDIPILDHIIIGKGKYYSFIDEGLL